MKSLNSDYKLDDIWNNYIPLYVRSLNKLNVPSASITGFDKVRLRTDLIRILKLKSQALESSTTSKNGIFLASGSDVKAYQLRDTSLLGERKGNNESQHSGKRRRINGVDSALASISNNGNSADFDPSLINNDSQSQVPDDLKYYPKGVREPIKSSNGILIRRPRVSQKSRGNYGSSINEVSSSSASSYVDQQISKRPSTSTSSLASKYTQPISRPLLPSSSMPPYVETAPYTGGIQDMNSVNLLRPQVQSDWRSYSQVPTTFVNDLNPMKLVLPEKPNNLTSIMYGLQLATNPAYFNPGCDDPIPPVIGLKHSRNLTNSVPEATSMHHTISRDSTNTNTGASYAHPSNQGSEGDVGALITSYLGQQQGGSVNPMSQIFVAKEPYDAAGAKLPTLNQYFGARNNNKPV